MTFAISVIVRAFGGEYSAEESSGISTLHRVDMAFLVDDIGASPRG